MDTIVTPVTVITLDSTRIVHSIKADLVARYFPPVVRLVQYDQSLPVIAVSLMQNGQAYTLPSGAAANIRVHKPDSTYVYNPALGCDSTRKIVYFEVTQAMAAASGDGLAIVEIVVDGDIAGTSLITLHFEENPVPEDAIESSDEWETIYELGERIIASTVTPVSTAAGMTDHNVVYLYTGTESGWNQGHMYYYNGTTWVDAGIAVTDTTLSVAGLAADAKKTGDEIATVKDGLNAITDRTDYAYSEGYINNSTSPVNINNVTVAGAWTHTVAPCVGGDVFTLTAVGGGTPRSWCFIKADGTIISNSGSYASATDEVIVAPNESAYLVSDDNGGTGYLYKGGYRIDNIVDLIETPKTYNFVNNGYVDQNDGVYHSYGTGQYKATDLIPVQVGNGINIAGSGIGEQYAFYDASRTFIGGHKNLNNVHTQPLSVPSNAKYFRMSLMPSGIDASKLSVTVLPIVEIAKQLYERYPRTDIIINCVGDSVTEGMGVDGDYTSAYGKDPYPAKLYTLLVDNGYDCIVNNYGHGGERIPDIATRIGAYPCVFLEDVTIPSSNEATSLGNMVSVDGRVTGTKIAVPYADGNGDDYCVFFTQTNADTNPLYIDGVEYTLTIGTNRNLINKRVADGKETVIKAGTFLFTRDNRNPSVNVVMGGINDGSSLTLKRYVDMMTACMNANGGHAIIIGSTHLLCSAWSDVTGSSAEEKWGKYHRACVEAFGNKFLDLYFEFPLHAVDYAVSSGYWSDKTQTELDAIQAKLDAHIIPSEMTVDGVENNVHLNEIGYQVIGMLVFERLKRLNYIQKSE